MHTVAGDAVLPGGYVVKIYLAALKHKTPTCQMLPAFVSQMPFISWDFHQNVQEV